MGYCKLTDTYINQVRTLYLENDLVKVGILVDKGTDIFEFIYKPLDIDFMWKSRLGVRSPQSFIPTITSKLGSFLDYYEGGWQELFPNADEPCIYKGADLGLHGEVCLMKWDVEVLENTPDLIELEFSTSTYRTPFHLIKIVRLKSGSSVLEFEETITNEGGEKMDFMWGHHPALGAPFLDKNCIISLPKCKVRSDSFLGSSFSRIAPDQDVEWPTVNGLEEAFIDLSKIPSPDIKCNDRVFIYDFPQGWYAVTNKVKGVGFAMQWDKDIFPYLMYWQSFSGWAGYPFYSSAYTMALEPRSSYPFPLTKVIQHNTQLELDSGDSLTTRYQAIAYESKKEILSINENGKVTEA
jgi:hypothetical protein